MGVEAVESRLLSFRVLFGEGKTLNPVWQLYTNPDVTIKMSPYIKQEELQSACTILYWLRNDRIYVKYIAEERDCIRMDIA